MKIRVRNLTRLRNLRYLTQSLLIIFFALLIDPAATRAQQTRTTTQEPAGVTVRTSSGSPVQIIADRKRVRVGEPVTFTLTPSNILKDRRYRVTVDFGDGTKIQTSQTQLTHPYQALGHYDVSVSVVESAVSFGQPEPAPKILRVSLFVKPTSVVAGSPVTFSARAASGNANLKYRFIFGDKSQTDWQDKSEATHVYPASGMYQAYVDVGVGDNGNVRQVAGSVRQPIEVSHPPFGAVALIVDPTSVEAGKPVTFSARIGSSDPNIKYRFSFGDGSSSDWQDSSQTTHSYAASGSYAANVDFGLTGNRAVKQLGSARQPVRVTPGPAAAVNLAVNPTSAEPGKPVTFIARSASRDPNIKYRFAFGDGSPITNWQKSPEATHKYQVAGSYAAHVEVGRSNNGRLNTIATSNTQQVSVAPVSTASPSPGVTAGTSPSPGLSPGSSASLGSPNQFGGASPSLGSSPGNGNNGLSWPSGLPQDWWKYPIIALLLIIAGYQLWKLFAAPQVLFAAHPDAGSSDVNGGLQELSIDYQVVLDPNVSEGQYLVFTDEAEVVRSVRRENG